MKNFRKTLVIALLAALSIGPLLAVPGYVTAARTASTANQTLANNFESSLLAIKNGTGTEEEKEAAYLALVEALVRAFPSYADEIVRDAIRIIGASNSLIAKMVERAGRAAPDQLLKIAKAAVAQAPDSLAAVNEVLLRLGATTGDRNPLDFPDGGTLNVVGGPATGGALGVTYLQLVISPAATNNGN